MTGSSRATGSSGSRLRSRNTTGYATRRRRSRRRGAGSRPSPPKANRTRVTRFLGFLRDRGGDGGGSHPSHPSHPSVSLATRDGPPVPEAARDFLAADVSRDADAVGPRGAHDIAAETEIYAKPKSPNKTQGKKRHASAFSRRRFPRPAYARRRAAPVRVFRRRRRVRAAGVREPVE